MVQALLGILAVMALWFVFTFAMDLKKQPKDKVLEDGSVPAHATIGFFINFFDTLGIGGFAPMTALFKQFGLVKDRIMPGTLNTAMCIPVIVEAFIFISDVKVETVTLVSMLLAAMAGAVIGAGFVSKLNERKVQLYMGSALFCVVLIMVSGKLGLMPVGGEAVGLTGAKLVIAVVANFILGALMTLGIGLYAPCMALVYALGMSPLVAFPIMMGSCAYLMPAASVKFIKEGAYNRKATLLNIIFGSVGVFVAAYLVKSLPLDILTWLVICVITYTAYTLIRDSRKGAEKEASAELQSA